MSAISLLGRTVTVIRKLMTVILKLLCALTLLPVIFAFYRALQWGFWGSAAYGFLGIVAFAAVSVFLWFIALPGKLVRRSDAHQA